MNITACADDDPTDCQSKLTDNNFTINQSSAPPEPLCLLSLDEPEAGRTYPYSLQQPL